MAGPCSLPNGNSRSEWVAQWVLVCDYHKDCTPDSHQVYDKHWDIIPHAFITRREWLSKRHRLTTGKTR